MWRVVGVGVGLPRHDWEVEGVVLEDDEVLVVGICGRARYAQAHVPERRCHRRVPCMFQGWLLRHEELVSFLSSTVNFFEEGHHRGQTGSQLPSLSSQPQRAPDLAVTIMPYFAFLVLIF